MIFLKHMVIKGTVMGTLLAGVKSFLERVLPSTTLWSRTSVIRDVRLIDGTVANGYLWMRKVRGVKQYKKMTEDEELQFFVDRW